MQVTVQGSHRVEVPPERATLSLLVLAEAGTREKALAEVTTTANALGAELAALAGVVSQVVSPVRVHAWRPTDASGRRLPERVSAQVDLTGVFADLDELAAFTARAGARDGVQVGGVGWSITDATRDRLEAETIAAALAPAHTRALAIARAAGASDVEVIEVADPGLLGGVDPRPEATAYRALASTGDFGGGGVDVVPADVEVVETLHVRFRVVGRP